MIHLRMDIESREQVVHLVHTFYGEVRKDELIGPIFDEAITDWPLHLEKMVSFWASTLLGEGSYRGEPFPKHLPLPIGRKHFDRWLQLFDAVLHKEFKGEKTEEASQRARTIGQIFALKIHHLRGESFK
jgi:hemoglobin